MVKGELWQSGEPTYSEIKISARIYSYIKHLLRIRPLMFKSGIYH